jgi:hypothetical protein
MNIYSFAINGTNLFAGTLGSSVWSRSLSEMVVSDMSTLSIPHSNQIPAQFSLGQNYPNPFNPTTTIDYELPITNYVRLVVNDILGKEVSVLVNEKQSAGSYKIEWDANNYPSGVYFYRLVSGNFALTKTMMLVR